MYVYQTAGGSRSGDMGWKKMKVSDAKFVGTINGAARTPREDYRFEDSGLHDYVCAL